MLEAVYSSHSTIREQEPAVTTHYEALPDAEAMAVHAARRISATARDAVDRRGRFTLALSGGTTPQRLYGLLASDPWRHGLPWQSTHVFWSDERWVPPDDARSNYGIARRLLLDRVPLPPSNIHPIRTEGAPTDAAATYSRAVSETVANGALDLVLLGMGEDGHTASLFPGSDALYVSRRGAVACHVPQLDAWRVSLTLAEINAARSVMVLVAGEDKAGALAAVRTGHSALPAARVSPSAGDAVWMTDAATAAVSRQLAEKEPIDDRGKRFAGARAAELVAEGMVVGLGTGSTARHFVAALGRRIRDLGLREVAGVATSEATERQALEEGIRLIPLSDAPSPDLTVDGADEVSPQIDLVKGMGGALVREKIVAAASARMLVVADETKLVDRLGTRSPLPVAVLPFGWQGHAEHVRGLGAEVALRCDPGNRPFVTDDGLYILDCRFGDGIANAAEIDAGLARRPGVVATGLFLDMAYGALVGDGSGTWLYPRVARGGDAV